MDGGREGERVKERGSTDDKCKQQQATHKRLYREILQEQRHQDQQPRELLEQMKEQQQKPTPRAEDAGPGDDARLPLPGVIQQVMSEHAALV
jgi:hypothetical protein